MKEVWSTIKTTNNIGKLSMSIDNAKSAGAMRMSAKGALLEEAERLRNKAELYEALAKELDGKLSESAELALWSLAMKATKN